MAPAPRRGRGGLVARLAAGEVGRTSRPRTLPEFASLAPAAFAALNHEHSGAPAALLELHELWACRDALHARAALLALSGACEFTSDGPARELPESLAAQRCIVLTGGWRLLVALLEADWDAAGAGARARALRHAALPLVRALGLRAGSARRALVARGGGRAPVARRGRRR
jgi:hypothetical protein